jgi:hypothetical protein
MIANCLSSVTVFGVAKSLKVKKYLSCGGRCERKIDIIFAQKISPELPKAHGVIERWNPGHAGNRAERGYRLSYRPEHADASRPPESEKEGGIMQDLSYLTTSYAREKSIESYDREAKQRRVSMINQEINSINVEIERLKVKKSDLTIEKININQGL